MIKKMYIRSSLSVFTLAATLGLAAPSAWAQQSPAGEAALKLRAAARSEVATSAAILSVARAGQRLVAVGDHGVVLLSDDQGKTFRQARSVAASVTLTGVSFADERHGWAVGQWGVILCTTDGGETWQVQRADTAVDQPLFSVYFRNSRQGIAVGLWSLVLMTEDGGAHWQVKSLPPPPEGGKADRNLYRIFANPKGDLFIAAEQGMVLRSTDGGHDWTYLKTGNKGSFWSGVALADGALLVGGLRGAVFRSKDNGDSWTMLETGTRSSIVDFSARGNQAVAVGLDGVELEIDGDKLRTVQREDRLPLTAVIQRDDGSRVMFSKKGVVSAVAPAR